MVKITVCINPREIQISQTKMSANHSNANQVNEITGQTHAHKSTRLDNETENTSGNTHSDSDYPSSSIGTSSDSE